MGMVASFKIVSFGIRTIVTINAIGFRVITITLYRLRPPTSDRQTIFIRRVSVRTMVQIMRTMTTSVTIIRVIMRNDHVYHSSNVYNIIIGRNCVRPMVTINPSIRVKHVIFTRVSQMNRRLATPHNTSGRPQYAEKHVINVLLLLINSQNPRTLGVKRRMVTTYNLPSHRKRFQTINMIIKVTKYQTIPYGRHHNTKGNRRLRKFRFRINEFYNRIMKSFQCRTFGTCQQWLRCTTKQA